MLIFHAVIGMYRISLLQIEKTVLFVRSNRWFKVGCRSFKQFSLSVKSPMKRKKKWTGHQKSPAAFTILLSDPQYKSRAKGSPAELLYILLNSTRK